MTPKQENEKEDKYVEPPRWGSFLFYIFGAIVIVGIMFLLNALDEKAIVILVLPVLLFWMMLCLIHRHLEYTYLLQKHFLLKSKEKKNALLVLDRRDLKIYNDINDTLDDIIRDVVEKMLKEDDE